MLDKDKIYGLSLEGGGFRGSYQAGAIMALIDSGIKIGAVCGTSVGAINAAFLVADKLKELKNLWLNFKVEDIFDVENEELEKALALDFKNISLKDLSMGIAKTTFNGGLDINPLINLLSKELDEDKIRKADMDFGLVTFNLTDKRPEELMLENMPEGTLIDYIVASSYLPAFKMQKLHGKFYIDGGFYNNMPSNMLAYRGFDDIIQIRLHRKSMVVKPKREVNLHTITYKKHLGPIIIHNQDKIIENFEIGYMDALKFIKS